MNNSAEILLKLLRIALGDRLENSLPADVDWSEVVSLSYREGVAALALNGLQQLSDSCNQELPEALNSSEIEDVKYRWLGAMLQTERANSVHNQRAAELTTFFEKDGYKSCILKGQGNALLYPNPILRQCGDIDIWVEGGRKRVLEYLRSKCQVDSVVVHHAKVAFFSDVIVEVHFIPAWLYNPFTNRRLQRFFESEANAQFGNMSELGFARPCAKFNLVFNVVHIYKHAFQDKVLLKQLVDYYFILQHSTDADRREAFSVLCRVGLGRFSSWLMGKLEKDLGMSPAMALCTASFGKCRRPFVEEVCLFPWKVWHCFARKGF